jgi:hypothetical protein
VSAKGDHIFSMASHSSTAAGLCARDCSTSQANDRETMTRGTENGVPRALPAPAIDQPAGPALVDEPSVPLIYIKAVAGGGVVQNTHSRRE